MSKEADLVAWLLENGGFVHPDLSLFSELENGDRGVRAKKAIAEGDQLLIVPKALCIYVRDHAGAKEQVGWGCFCGWKRGSQTSRNRPCITSHRHRQTWHASTW